MPRHGRAVSNTGAAQAAGTRASRHAMCTASACCPLVHGRACELATAVLAAPDRCGPTPNFDFSRQLSQPLRHLLRPIQKYIFLGVQIFGSAADFYGRNLKGSYASTMKSWVRDYRKCPCRCREQVALLEVAFGGLQEFAQPTAEFQGSRGKLSIVVISFSLLDFKTSSVFLGDSVLPSRGPSVAAAVMSIFVSPSPSLSFPSILSEEEIYSRFCPSGQPFAAAPVSATGRRRQQAVIANGEVLLEPFTSFGSSSSGPCEKRQQQLGSEK
ncbi:activity-regulated cytoskeleton-associated protein [Striga asiatica]|uniref:Activity-regulated cytoskeleton-associated protein n=1 Tax=Striga asiatica TaxID=4170 RepID=A0A5A7RDB3_STRAF|nr:activity-regulated cytoskeleton-associated protein [Striga asiatica]